MNPIAYLLRDLIANISAFLDGGKGYKCYCDQKGNNPTYRQLPPPLGCICKKK